VNDEKLELTKQALRCVEQGLRKAEVEDIFERVCFILPEKLRVEFAGNEVRPRHAFNPAAELRGKSLLIYPRLILDELGVVSVIGGFELDVEQVLSADLSSPVECELFLTPAFGWEKKGCEDPRVFVQAKKHILYTACGEWVYRDGKVRIDALAHACLDELDERSCVTLAHQGKHLLPYSNKDACIISMRGGDAYMLLRPELRIRGAFEGKLRVVHRGVFDSSSKEVRELSPVLGPERFETKVGCSTNAVELGKSEYLVGFHGVSKADFFYRNGFLVVNEAGELLGLTDYLLAPDIKNQLESLGPYVGVIFGDGLVRYKELLLWIGGVADSRMGVFSCELDEVLERVRWLR
jgi:predicted GH43/DUF377 family glycosyl hydrolase